MGLPVIQTLALTAGSANAIALSQTPLGAGSLTLNGALVSGGVAILSAPRRVLFTFAANETGHSFVLTGNQRIDGTGNTISETIAGTTIGTVQSVFDYGRVTSITIDAAATGAMTVGTNGVGSTPWIQVNYHAQPVNLTVAFVPSGTVNITGQYTYDQFWLPSVTPTTWDDPLLTSKSSKADSTINDPITGYRFTVNSGTGTATLTYIQAGIKG